MMHSGLPPASTRSGALEESHELDESVDVEGIGVGGAVVVDRLVRALDELRNAKIMPTASADRDDVETRLLLSGKDDGPFTER